MNKYYVKTFYYGRKYHRFYKVVKETDKTMWLTEVCKQTVEGDCWCGTEIPTDEPISRTSIITVRKNNSEYRLWDGKPLWYDELD